MPATSTVRWVLAALVTLAVASAGVAAAVEFGGATGATRPTYHTPHISTPHTRRVVLRPVHADGIPAAGYRVVTQDDGAISCDVGVSPSAVDPDIRTCGYTALGTVSCWRSTGHTVLCLRDAFSRTLVRLTYSGAFADAAAPRHPAPQGVVLTTGTRCRVRDGGVWNTVPGHPDWAGGYWCGSSALYGPAGGTTDGLVTSTALWRTYEVADDSRRVADRAVATAYYVGTAD